MRELGRATSIRHAARRAIGSARLVTAAATVLGGLTSATIVTTAVATAGAPAASAATSAASTLTKTGTDTTIGTSASSQAGTAPGVTEPGDTLEWVLHYANNSGAKATVDQTDPITGPQTYVAGSLQTPPSLSTQYSTDGGSTWTAGAPPAGANGVGATGTVPPVTTSSVSPTFTSAQLSFNTPGGDGYSVEGQGNEVYTVFHHTGPNQGPGFGSTVVYCATLTNAVCSGWPAYSTYVSTTAGAPIHTGGIPDVTTAGENGSFIADNDLFWEVEGLQAVNGAYPVGLQCLNLTTLDSCGFTQLDTTSVPAVGGTAAMISGDGIAAGNGNYYFFDGNGNIVCFNPTSGACNTPTNVTNGQIAGNSANYLASILTSGPYVFETYAPPAGGGALDLTCYDTATSATCPGYPINEGAKLGNPDYLAPVLNDGSLTGICDVAKAACYTPTGTLMASDPYTGYVGFGDLTPGPGFGSGTIVGNKFYTAYPSNPADVNTTTVLCFDFSLWTGTGAVPQCSGFAGQVDEQNYTVRGLANLPGCMAADGNLGHIIIFNEQTGGSCVTASQSVALTPSQYYCDGLTNHATSWGTVSLNGLTGSEYSAATLTLVGVTGPVPGYTDLVLAPGQTSLDLSALPVSGNTASLTAEITLTGVTNPTAVNAATMTLSWKGDPIETCFKTTVDDFCPPAGAVVSNTGNVITTGINGTTDGPGGTSSGTAAFEIVPTSSQCALTTTKTASQSIANPGDTVTYTITVKNSGTVPWTAANPAQITDDLTKVVTDGAVNQASITASTGTASYNGSTSMLTWTGALAAGGTTTTTYVVTVDMPDTGPHDMTNSVTPVCPAYASCPAPPAVSVPITGFKVVKSTPDLVATPGQKVTYSITVTNTGQVPYPDMTSTPANPSASFTDDLTGDVTDATFNNDATATAGAITYTAPTLSWTGPLPVGATVTVAYSVTVNDPDTGPHNLANSVTGGDNCQVPSADPSECTTNTPIADYQVVKTASPSATPLMPGDTVTYTVSATNKGPVAYPDSTVGLGNATWTDDLAGDLQDATYNNDAKTSAGTVSYATPSLAWSGPLPVGGTVTTTYSVTVNAPDNGPHSLDNTVSGGSNCSPPSANPSECSASNPIADYKTVKTASEQTANPGDKVTYTILVVNTGQVAFTTTSPASFSDDLTGDLADAVYDNDASASAGTVNYANPLLSWSGALAVGQTVTVTYSVTVDKPDTGPHLLKNTVTNPTNCKPGSTDPSCSTTTPVYGLHLTKSTSASSVAPGQKVTYTITVTNTGQAAYTTANPATFSDDLTNDLGDATYNGDAKASAGTVSFSAPNIIWSGALVPGASATVTYSVTVDSPDTGPHKLLNTVTSPDPGHNCLPGSTDPSCTTSDPVTTPALAAGSGTAYGTAPVASTSPVVSSSVPVTG